MFSKGKTKAIIVKLQCQNKKENFEASEYYEDGHLDDADGSNSVVGKYNFLF